MLYIILGIVAVLLVHAWLMSTKPHKINWATSHVVITGGSSGIGLCTALIAVKRGANVTILARNADKLKAALKTLESARVNGDQKLLALSTDVSDLEAIKKTIDDAVARNNGKMDLLIACAGETRPERFDEVDPKYFKRLMEINYLGAVYSILAVLPYMKTQKRGRVVVVGSLLSITGFPGYSPYTPTKYALKGLLDGLDIEYRPFNIFFQLAIPADVDTPMYAEENRIKPEETKLLSDPPTSPESVATSIVSAVDSYTYMISTGLQGALLKLTVGGLSPGSFSEILLQICFGGVLRAATVVFLKYYYYVVAKVRRREKFRSADQYASDPEQIQPRDYVIEARQVGARSRGPSTFVHGVDGVAKTFREESGYSTGIVVSSGDGVTQVVPVFFGHAIEHASAKLDVGGIGHSMSGLFPLSELVQGEPDLLKLEQKYSRPASDAQIEQTKKSLEAKGHKVSVVNTASEAVALLKDQIPEGSSVYNAGSTTLSEIGFLDVLKTETKWKNLHAEILAEPDQVKAAELRRLAMSADYFLSSVSALSEDGALVVADATGTRVGGFAHSAKHVLVVTGSNKIVPTHEDAVARTQQYVFPIESARARKAYGAPGSMLNFLLSINHGNPFAPGRIHVVIVKAAFGY